MHNLDVNIRPGPDSSPVTTGTNEPAAPACCHPTPALSQSVWTHTFTKCYLNAVPPSATLFQY